MPFLCHFKGKPYSNVDRHSETPVEEDIKPFVCDRCHFVGSNFLELDAHKSACGNNYNCTSCPEVFSNSNLLELHKLNHAEVVKYDLVFSSNGEIHMETTPLDQRLANPIKEEYQDFQDIKVEPSEEAEIEYEPRDVKCDIKVKNEEESFEEFDTMMSLYKKDRLHGEELGYRYYKKSTVKLLKNVQWKNDKEYQKLQDIKMEYDPVKDQLREEARAARRARKELRRERRRERKSNKEAADSTKARAHKKGKKKSKKSKETKTDENFQETDDEGLSNVKISHKRKKSDTETQQTGAKNTSKSNSIVYENGLYLCEFCDYSNEKIHSVKMHRIMHLVEKPYVCNRCPKTFRQKSHLKNHKARHAKGHKKTLFSVSPQMRCLDV